MEYYWIQIQKINREFIQPQRELKKNRELETMRET